MLRIILVLHPLVQHQDIPVDESTIVSLNSHSPQHFLHWSKRRISGNRCIAHLPLDPNQYLDNLWQPVLNLAEKYEKLRFGNAYSKMFLNTVENWVHYFQFRWLLDDCIRLFIKKWKNPALEMKFIWSIKSFSPAIHIC